MNESYNKINLLMPAQLLVKLHAHGTTVSVEHTNRKKQLAAPHRSSRSHRYTFDLFPVNYMYMNFLINDDHYCSQFVEYISMMRGQPAHLRI